MPIESRITHRICSALEGISTALAAEVEPEWNIKVCAFHMEATDLTLMPIVRW